MDTHKQPVHGCLIEELDCISSPEHSSNPLQVDLPNVHTLQGMQGLLACRESRGKVLNLSGHTKCVSCAPFILRLIPKVSRVLFRPMLPRPQTGGP